MTARHLGAIMHPAHDSHRQEFCTYNEEEVDALAAVVKAALEGDDTETVRDALAEVAECLGIDWGGR